ncbi:hypothetical protein Mpt1_c00460 [Candidatus Methanoplasma termitum]|uniref:Uncharacterized protein n=1 Tax=Candidatus Methanoplasma termitum TaxID=1577791 RepID=A0A0A7LAA2_9ARCH|nr:hypothetical protein [Candidatus Methanoplasma termitum]AIZ55953.1 hypothetical protein Mpt1_c00460 [Candidatus Methanoplasma termitum]MCL2334271.1 hypothetical protein [Candidatus Methanoplasma sp.]
MKIDTSYKADWTGGKDADMTDPILRDYHKLLWSKPLPDGRMFDLTVSSAPPYRLFHSSEIGTFSLSSDSIVHTYSRLKNGHMTEVVGSLPKHDIDAFYDLVCTIGAYLVFPSNKIDNKATINVERGFNGLIKDRFDFTLECIRRWYIGEKNPLRDCFDRYTDFFRLFTDFRGYVEFFLLDDIVDEDENVRFWLPFRDFGSTPPLPNSVTEYKEYMKNASDFTKARNKRMAAWAMTLP